MTGTLLFLMILHVTIFHVDEYYFHRRRTLCRKEVLSMFLDGVLFLPPLVIASFAPVTETWISIYTVLAILSCISVIKNEWFFLHDVSKKERVVHAALYVLHPILLYTFFISWVGQYLHNNFNFYLVQIFYMGFGVKTLTHQLIYWNYLRPDCK